MLCAYCPNQSKLMHLNFEFIVCFTFFKISIEFVIDQSSMYHFLTQALNAFVDDRSQYHWSDTLEVIWFDKPQVEHNYSQLKFSHLI